MKPILFLAPFLLLTACDKKAAPDAKPPEAQTPAATGPITEERLGVKLFPGARIVTSGETAEIVSANLRTSEPAAAVIKFYEEELGLPLTAKNSGTFSGTKNNRKYSVSVNSSEGSTNVSIMGKK